MSTDPNNVAGTTPTEPPADGTAPAAGTTGEPGAGGTTGADDLEAVRAENERLRQAQEQWLGEKTRWEQERRELEQRRQAGVSTPPTNDPLLVLAQQARDAYAIANNPNADPVDRLNANITITGIQGRFMQLQQERLAWDNELAKVPSADQAEVERIAQQNGVMPSWAYDRLVRQRNEAEKAERERQSATRAAAQPTARNVPTSITPVAGAAVRDSGYTEEEYLDLARRAGPPLYDPAARQRLNEIDAGLVKPRAG